MEHLAITRLSEKEAHFFADYFKKLGWQKPLSQFLTYINEENQGIRTNFVGVHKGAPTGYITILWKSDHSYFFERHIPEIKDLNVFPEHRNHGIGTALLHACENEIAKRAEQAGIGVGLTEDYGAAQRLYVKNGYIPNGEGVSSHHHNLIYGSTCLVDDDLILWFTKKLR